jgi:uncharacterized lipoprotein
MPLLNLRRGVFAVLVMACSLATGCAGNRRETYLQDKASSHVYRQPIAEVWLQAKALLSEEGYSFREAQGRREMETEWLMLGAPSSLGTTYARYLVRGIEKAPGQTTVAFHRQVRVVSSASHDTATGGTAAGPGTDSNTLDRDREMEWKLLQRVDAEAAKNLQAEAAQNVR